MVAAARYGPTVGVPRAGAGYSKPEESGMLPSGGYDAWKRSRGLIVGEVPSGTWRSACRSYHERGWPR